MHFCLEVDIEFFAITHITQRQHGLTIAAQRNYALGCSTYQRRTYKRTWSVISVKWQNVDCVLCMDFAGASYNLWLTHRLTCSGNINYMTDHTVSAFLTWHLEQIMSCEESKIYFNESQLDSEMRHSWLSLWCCFGLIPNGLHEVLWEDGVCQWCTTSQKEDPTYINPLVSFSFFKMKHPGHKIQRSVWTNLLVLKF